MTTIQQIKTQLASTKSVASQYGLEKELEKIDKLISYGESKQLSLFVCGEFKRGKSSFINALLSEEVCPVAEGIATSVVSIIRYGKNRKVIRHYGNMVNEQVEPCKEEIPFEKIAAYADGTVSDIDNTIMLEIEIPAERLKNGLTIIDTPGVGSLDPRHLFLTLYALPKADVIFFITDVGEPLTSTELDFYKKHILSTGKPNRIIVNKSDSKLREECNQIILDTKHKFEEHCGVKNVHVLPVSAKLWLEYNEEPDNEKKRQKSHMDDVLAAIEGVEKDFEQFFSELIRSQYIDLLQQMIDLANKKKVELSNNNDIANKKEGYQRQITELKQLRDDIANPNSAIRHRFSKTIKDSQKQVKSKFAEKSILLSSDKLEKILMSDKVKSSEGNDFVVTEINKAIIKLAEDLDKDIDAGIKEVLEIVGKDISLSDESFNGQLNVHINPLQQTISEKAMNITRQSLPFMGVTALAGTGAGIGLGLSASVLGLESAFAPIAGIAALTPIGLIAGIIGVAAGVTYVLKSIKNSNETAEINNIRKQILPRIQISMNELQQYIQNRYEEFNDILLQSLSDSALQMTTQMQQILNLIKECEDNEQHKKAKLNELDTQIKFLNTQLIQAKVVNTNPFAK